MKREFVYFTEFDECWKRLGLDDERLRKLEFYLSNNPKSGDIIKGTGGVRKLRWNLEGKGKRGGIRTIYIDFAGYEKIYLITAYLKSDKDNLNQNEKENIKEMIKLLTYELKRK